MTSSKKKASSHYVALTKTVHLFSLMKALEQHLLLQDYSYFSEPEDIYKTSVKVKILFAQKLKDTKIAERNYLTSSIGNDCTSASRSKWRKCASFGRWKDNTMGIKDKKEEYQIL